MTYSSFRFGPFQLRTGDRTLWRGDTRVDLNARYLDVLILLIEARGELVTKDRFMQEVWRGIPVTDEALTQAIRTLRKALGDEVSAPRFVETVPKYGYRFIAPIDAGSPQMVAAAPAGASGSRSQFGATVAAGLSGAATAGLLIGLIYGLWGASGGAAAGTSGSGISLVLVVTLVTIAAAAAGGLGIAAGIAASRFIDPQRWYWSTAGGALGGLMFGAFAHLIGSDAFLLLFGQRLDRFAGALEGAVIGAAIGLAIAAGRERRETAGIAAALGLLGGAGVALLDGQMMAGSLQELLIAFPDSRMRISGIGMLFGERGLGSIGLTLSAALEGATFCAAVAWGLRSSPAHRR
ncbi:transcriptional regulator [Erythrobacter sp. NFXS35]|uniref:winged helix-turn-helix domain-containing protein n=1 Tax=Erythrobacter sp. NFXS35 TaxID=2818436 RepID=UPI0032DF3EE0